jgi:hypothetical protein
MNNFSFTLLLLILFSLPILAQQKEDISTLTDTTKTKESFKTKFNNTTKEIGLLFKDTTKLQPPRKAVLRSAIIPGWGQARNGKWWKTPLVYGGFVGLGLVYDFNNKFYKETLAESQFRKENPSGDRQTVFKFSQYRGISDNQIFSAKDFYRRNRDLSLYSMFGFWGLQMIDAYIDAKLATFDISDDLSLQIKPSIYAPQQQTFGFNSAIPMLAIKIKLKN